jgi:Family of unknown function (DUF6152)
MRHAGLAVIALAAAGVGAPPAFAHHSFAADYYEAQNITVDGRITAFLYRNPHTFVEIESTDASGVATKWIAEWYGAGRLSRIGVNADTFKPGDKITMTGAPSRDSKQHRMHLKTLERPSDGLKFDRSAGGRTPR